jgi:hypothetical protein
MPGESQMSEVPLPLRTALCRLRLRGDQWVPLGVNTELTAKHRSCPDGPVIQAVFFAFARGERIVGWKDGEAFDIHEVQADGSLKRSLDTDFWAEVLWYADLRDKEARSSGAAGISRQLVDRRLKREKGRVPNHLRQAAIDQAAELIIERLRGRRVRGVSLLPPRDAGQVPES